MCSLAVDVLYSSHRPTVTVDLYYQYQAVLQV